MTPSSVAAMALLSGQRGVRLSTLQAHTERLSALLEQQGAQPAASMSGGKKALGEALVRFQASRLIELLPDEVDEVVQVNPRRRVTLDYYKNNLLHFLAPMSLLAAVIRTTHRPFRSDDEEIIHLFRMQVFLLRYECTLDPESSLEALEQDSLEALLSYGALTEEAGTYTVADLDRLSELAVLTDNLRESYRLALQACFSLRSRDVEPKDLPQKVLTHGRARLAVGELSMPESLSIVNLKVALDAYREEGVIQFRAGGGLQFEQAVMEQYLSDLGRLLPGSDRPTYPIESRNNDPQVGL
jgi:glycerol-3-phosphate O-acyltransferase